MNVFELFGTIAIDNSAAERGLDKTVGHAKDAENALEKTFKRIGKFVAAAFSIKAVIDFGKSCTQVYADIAAEAAAFEQVMGDSADMAQAKLDAVAAQTGVSATRMTSAFTSMTAKFKGLGYDVEDATTLASDALLIASDASAFWNMSLDESMAHLNSFVNGSYQGGEAIGLFANDTQMAAYAIEKGIVASTAEWAKLDEATKQATRLDFAKTMQANSGVTGQAAREANEYQNVLGNLTEAWRQFQAIIGKPILERFVLPVMRKLTDMMPGLTEAVQKGIDWLTEGFDKIAAYFSEVFTEDGMDMKAFPNALRNMFRDAVRSIPALLSSVGRSIRNAWVNTVWPGIQKACKVAFGIDLPEWSDIESDILAWWDGGNGIAAKIADVCNWTLNLFGKPADVSAEDVKTVLDSWWTGAKGLVESFCTWTLMLFENPIEGAEAAKNKVLEWWDTVRSGAESALEWTLTLFGVPKARAEAVVNLVHGWWQGIYTFAEGALEWTLKLFENPEETAGQVATNISTWWAGVKSSAESALNWWLKLFDNPLEAGADVKKLVEDWWAGVKADAESALIWALKLFGVPLAEGDGVKKLVSGWWQGVKGKAQEALSWTLKLFENPEETAGQVGTFISTWWATVVNSAIDACKWVLNLFGIPVEDADDVKAVIDKWWKGVKSGAESALDWTLKLFGVPTEDAATIKTTIKNWWKGIVDTVQTACAWVLGMGEMPEAEGENGVVNTIEKWWEGIAKKLESVFAIDLSGIDVAGIFTAASTAIQGVIDSAKTFAGDVAKSIAFDVNGRVRLGATLSNLFDAGVKAISNLLTNAGNLVGNIVAAVTGDEEAGNKIGGVFTDLFSWANEVIINVKTGAIDAFKWLVDNKDLVIGAIAGILGAFVVTNPVAAFFTTLTALVVALSTDWENFEENFPDLVSMFEDFTKLNFTDVVTSLEAFKSTLGGILTFLSENSLAVDLLLVTVGAIAMASGHPLMGAALITAGGYSVWNEAVEIQEKNKALYGDNTTTPLDDYLQYAQSMYSNPGKYGLTESELSDYIDILAKKNPFEEGYEEAASAVVEAWMRVNGPGAKEEDSSKPDGKSSRESEGVDVHGNVRAGTFNPETYVPAGFNGMQSMVQTMQNMLLKNNDTMMASVQEGVIAGLSGVTVKVDVNTGDVVLSDRTIVGKLTPKINAALGALAQRSGRTKG